MKRIELIEFLKGYAIFTIVVFHFLQNINLPSPLDSFISFGGTGVHLFIFLSGFGLYLSHLNKPLNYINFVKKRISKVYIPYILVIILSALIAFFLPVYQNSLYAFGGHLFLYKMFDEAIIGSYGFPLWFISMIIQFYIVFIPLTYLAKKIKAIYFVLIGIIISAVWILLTISLGNESLTTWNRFFLQFIWEFIIGMVLASIYFQNNYSNKFTPKQFNLLLLGVICSGIYGLLALKGGNIGKMLNDIPALIGYTSLAIWLYQLKITFINKFFLFTGKISFSIYLLHFLILRLAILLADSLSLSLAISMALFATYITAYYYQIIIGKLYRIMKI